MGLFDKLKNRNQETRQEEKKDGFLKIEVKPLIEWKEPNGEGCIVSDMITKEGWKVGYMFRDEPLENQPDSGWHFFKGDESDAYSNDAGNFHVFALNTVCNYDPDIIPYLRYPVGTYLIRTADGKLIEDDGSQAIHFERQ